MPCTYWEPNTPDPGSGSSYAQLESQIAEQKSKLDSLTNMLCQVCRHIDDSVVSDQSDYNEFKRDIPKEILTWWEHHKKMDNKRLKAEAKAKRLKELKEGALAKLTKEEKTALGLTR